MVLRGLLARGQGELKVFRSTARLPGFAQQLSLLLRELQQQRFSADGLMELANQPELPAGVREKLHDVALLLRAYREWLAAHRLHDGEETLAFAAEALRGMNETMPAGLQLWFDGFAEMTPLELNLLTALVPFCRQATLAFCLEEQPAAGSGSWLSPWATVAQTFRRCHAALRALPGCEVSVQILKRGAAGRFAGAPVLAHVEERWVKPQPWAARSEGDGARSEPREAAEDLFAWAAAVAQSAPAARRFRTRFASSPAPIPRRRRFSPPGRSGSLFAGITRGSAIAPWCCARWKVTTTSCAACSPATKFPSSSIDANRSPTIRWPS
jgi:hypothetical protein